MGSADEAKAAKDAGNAALSAKDFKKAVERYSEAIELDPDNSSGSLHIFHSNRCAAYLKQGEGLGLAERKQCNDKALQDAKKCTSLKPEWAKGFARKGAALHAKNMMTMAAEAYTKAVELDPSNTGYQDSLADASKSDERSRFGGSASQPASSSASTPVPPSTGAPSTSLKDFMFGDKKKAFATFQYVLRTFMLVNFLIFTFALGASGMVAYYRFLKAAALNYSSFLLFHHGVPKFNKAYLGKLVQDSTSHFLWYCFIFVMFPPMFVAIVPVVLSDFTHLAWYLSSAMEIVSPKVHTSFADITNKVMPVMMDNDRWGSYSANEKWRAVNANLPSLCADIEVGVGVIIIVQMVTPFRNFILLFVYWQFLRIRYIVSPQIKGSFSTLDQKMGTVFNHKYAPPFFASGYDKLKGLLASQTRLPEPGESAMPKMPKCTIM
jgi:stress-induced-phosphoprotein 1